MHRSFRASPARVAVVVGLLVAPNAQASMYSYDADQYVLIGRADDPSPNEDRRSSNMSSDRPRTYSSGLAVTGQTDEQLATSSIGLSAGRTTNSGRIRYSSVSVAQAGATGYSNSNPRGSVSETYGRSSGRTSFVVFGGPGSTSGEKGGGENSITISTAVTVVAGTRSDLIDPTLARDGGLTQELSFGLTLGGNLRGGSFERTRFFDPVGEETASESSSGLFQDAGSSSFISEFRLEFDVTPGEEFDLDVVVQSSSEVAFGALGTGTQWFSSARLAVEIGNSAARGAGGFFTLPEGFSISSTDGLIVDNAVVPSPSAFAVLGFGGLLAARRRRA